MIAPDLRSELESYLGFLIDHELEDAYEAEPLNRTLSENKPAFPRAVASSGGNGAHNSVTPRAGNAVNQLKPPALANADMAALLHEARQRATAARTLDELYAELDAFQHMPLRHEGGRGPIRFRGNTSPALLVIGEAPDEDDDATGHALAGKGGALLDKALAAAGVGETSMLTPAVFWRPAGGRPLTAEDIDINAPFLHALVRLAAPKAIVLLGASAISALLNLDQSLARVRGRVLRYEPTGANLPVIASYPPSLLLRQPEAKGLFWRDLLMATAGLN